MCSFGYKDGRCYKDFLMCINIYNKLPETIRNLDLITVKVFHKQMSPKSLRISELLCLVVLTSFKCVWSYTGYLTKTKDQ